MPELLLCHGVASSVKGKELCKGKKTETHQDAEIERGESEISYYFMEGVTVYETARVDASNVTEIIEQISDKEIDIDAIVERHPKLLGHCPFGFTVMVITGEGTQELMNPETLARILFAETGSLGKTELSFINDSILDFGEHLFVVSPSGALVIGEIEDQEKYLYLIAQTMVGVTTYTKFAEELKELLFESSREVSESQLIDRESALEDKYEMTRYVISDIRDEMLNADARDSLIISLLHRHMSIKEHEERVQNFLHLAARRIDRSRMVKQIRDAKRIGAILFATGIIIGISNFLATYVNLTKNLNILMTTAMFFIATVLIGVIFATVWVFRDVFTRKLKF